MNDWWDYVQRITGSATQQAIADKTGIGQSSIARWREKSPRPDSAATFARAYGRPPHRGVQVRRIPQRGRSEDHPGSGQPR
ncbi:helix-turn-helix transcriptional regulator [Streptosporangium vulgare]|uniref:helix-turn-helix domain-containing protein n=1 Tax=Streptosporangium vulgare TaxID=46190 RepID=UPI0031CFAAB9